MSTHKKHLLIADSNDISSKEMRVLLQKKYTECKVSFAKNGFETLSILKSEKVDMVIFDVDVVLECEVDTLAICKQLMQQVALIGLFSSHNTLNLTKFMDGGVKGFIKKTHINLHLIEAIEALSVNANFFETTLLINLLKETEGVSKSNSGFIKKAKLTADDLKLMTYISEEYTNSDIAKLLCLSKKTLENRIRLLVLKLEVKSKIGVAFFAGKFGGINKTK